ncbi:MAG: carbon starvation protein A [Nitrospirota bacterium]
MNVSVLIIITLPLFYIAYRVYSQYIAGVLGEDDNRQTPAVEFKDGRDYVPTKRGVIFSHHFASISGAGPIIGPTVAVLYGYLPVWLWVIIGGIFIGAVHDYTSLFVSLQKRGRSMADVAGSTLGKTGFLLFIIFTLILIVLVTSAFLGLTATALSSFVPLEVINMESGQSLFHTVIRDGREMVQIGGIASTSVIIMTCFAPLLGWLLYRKNLSMGIGMILAIVTGIGSIYIGILSPISIYPDHWMIILTVYCLFASSIPVWIILQPRDFINSFILYLGIAVMIAGIIGGGIKGVSINAPALNFEHGFEKLGMIWPFLFITVACGAISGFHSLVAGGTVSKQIKCESHARTIGYGGMLMESLLAVGVISAISAGLSFGYYQEIVFPSASGAKANPILAFALSMGGLLHKGIGLPMRYGIVFGILMVEGFVITTLDTAVRLNRYLFQELWETLFKNTPDIMKSSFFNGGLSVLLMLYMGYTNRFKLIWPVFGSANQLLAALTLIAVAVWLANRNKKIWFVIIPAIFMMITTIAALSYLLIKRYIPSGNITLAIADLLLLSLSAGVIILAVKRLSAIRALKAKNTAQSVFITEEN